MDCWVPNQSGLCFTTGRLYFTLSLFASAKSNQPACRQAGKQPGNDVQRIPGSPRSSFCATVVKDIGAVRALTGRKKVYFVSGYELFPVLKFRLLC
jgi:hypothetical protein